jgi:hypothetical protein
MLKPIAAGLMCLGFVTLSVAISQGQDEETPLPSATDLNATDLIVIDGKLNATEVTAGEAKENPQARALRRTYGPYEAVPASGTAAGGETNISVNGQRFRIVRSENGGVVVSNEDGKIVEKYPAGSDPGRFAADYQFQGTQRYVNDPPTREILEKMIVGLKEQIQKLENEGKKEEAQQKTQSLQAIEALLHGNPRIAALGVLRNNRDPKQTMEEIKKLHARLSALAEEKSKLPEGAVGERDKIFQMIERVKAEIAEQHQSLTAPAAVRGQPPQFGIGQGHGPGMAPSQFAQQPQGAPGFHRGGIGFVPGIAPPGFARGQPQGFGGSEGMAMLRKSEALSQAAAQLKSNGLDEQAQPLLAQAQEFKAKAEKMMQEEAENRRAQAAEGVGSTAGGGAGGFGTPGGAGGRGFGGFFGMGAGPPTDLHNSLRELQEQIQQLRKEVGEVRELLQRK